MGAGRPAEAVELATALIALPRPWADLIPAMTLLPALLKVDAWDGTGSPEEIVLKTLISLPYLEWAALVGNRLTFEEEASSVHAEAVQNVLRKNALIRRG